MKNSYAIDDKNRLIVKRKSGNILPKGEFSIDKNNGLAFGVKENTAWRRQYGLTGKIRFKGRWHLDANNDLELILDESVDQFKNERLVFSGEIISADRDAFAFHVKSLDRQGLLHLQILQLSGKWQADERNRIIFEVKKKASPDTLALAGSWQLNNNQQVAYSYEKTELKTKTKIAKSISFEGFWQINSGNKLAYVLRRGAESRFDFRVQLETPNIYPKQGVIKYRLGTGLKEGSSGSVIPLYGAWKLSDKLGLAFEMDYGKSGVRCMEFGADVLVRRNDKITLALKDKRGTPVGLNMTLTHKLENKPGAESFLCLREAFKKETSIEAGVRIPF